MFTIPRTVLALVGMITRLFDEMEQEGIDELDFAHFESVVCRTLGDIALARSRAQQVDNTAVSVCIIHCRPFIRDPWSLGTYA